MCNKRINDGENFLWKPQKLGGISTSFGRSLNYTLQISNMRVDNQLSGGFGRMYRTPWGRERGHDRVMIPPLTILTKFGEKLIYDDTRTNLRGQELAIKQT